jgi:hypothetical protein
MVSPRGGRRSSQGQQQQQQQWGQPGKGHRHKGVHSHRRNLSDPGFLIGCWLPQHMQQGDLSMPGTQMQGPASPPPQHSSHSSRRHSDFGDWHKGGGKQQQQQQQLWRPWSPRSPACERPATPTAAAAADLAAAVAAGSGAAAACAAAGAEAAAAAADGIKVDADTAVYVRKLLPRKMAKYWLQRYSLFSRFDQGVQMDVQVRGSTRPVQGPCAGSTGTLETQLLCPQVS